MQGKKVREAGDSDPPVSSHDRCFELVLTVEFGRLF